MRLFYRYFIVFLVMSSDIQLVMASESEAGSNGNDGSSRPEEQVFILSVTAGKLTLTDSLLTYYDGKNLLIPLGRFAAALEFPITVNSKIGTAKGWYFDEDKSFDLDMQADAVTLSGAAHPYDPDLVERHQDDIYVVSTELEKWFSIRLIVQLRRLQIDVESRTPLPIEDRLARQKRQARLTIYGNSRETGSAVQPPVDFLEWPFIDVSLSLNNGKTGTQQRSRISQTATVTGVIGDLDAEATYYAFDNFKSPNLRLRLGRKSLDGDLLGPLHAHEYAVGDIATPSLPLISDNVTGRGLMISSFSLDELDNRNQITLRGNLPAGWEVELYRNEELLRFQAGQDVGGGRYEFQNVPTVIGLNEFRLVFYGPQGQKREETERYFISPEMGKPGKTSFRLAVNQANKDMIAIEPAEFTPVDTGKERVVFQLEHGLTETTSMRYGLVSLSLDGERHNYFSAGLGSSLAGSLVNLDLGYDTQGGFAVGGTVQALIDAWSITARQQWFQGLVSERSEDLAINGEEIVSYSDLDLFGKIPDGFGILSNHPISASLTHRIGVNGNWQSDIRGRVSYLTRQYNLAVASRTRIGSLTDFDSGLTLIGSTSGPLRWRGEVNLDPFEDSVFESSSIFADWTLSEKTGVTGGVRYSSFDKDIASFSTGLYHKFDQLNLGLNVNADTERNYDLGLSLSFSLGHNPTEQTVEMRGNQFARSSAVSALVFLDKNNDGKFNSNDKPIENVGFSGSVPSRIRTTSQGSAFIPGMAPYSKLKIGLDEETLENPTWRTADPPKLLSLRPGVTTELLFPVVETGEIDGWVLSGENAGRPLPGVSIGIYNDKGEKIVQTATAYDGYYFLGEIPLGTYKIALDSQQLSSMGFGSVSPISILLTEEDPFVLDQNFEITR